MSPCSSWSGETMGRLQQVHFELWSNRIREAYLTLPKCHATDKNRYKSVFIHCIISSGETILTAYRRTGTRTHVYADYTQLNLQPTLPDSKQGLEVKEDSSGAGNMAGLLFWRKKKCLDVWLKESREGFCRRGRGRSFIVEGRRQKRRGNQQWRVWCEASGGWEYQEQIGECGRVCKLEISQCQRG